MGIFDNTVKINKSELLFVDDDDAGSPNLDSGFYSFAVLASKVLTLLAKVTSSS